MPTVTCPDAGVAFQGTAEGVIAYNDAGTFSDAVVATGCTNGTPTYVASITVDGAQMHINKPVKPGDKILVAIGEAPGETAGIIRVRQEHWHKSFESAPRTFTEMGIGAIAFNCASDGCTPAAEIAPVRFRSAGFDSNGLGGATASKFRAADNTVEINPTAPRTVAHRVQDPLGVDVRAGRRRPLLTGSRRVVAPSLSHPYAMLHAWMNTATTHPTAISARSIPTTCTPTTCTWTTCRWTSARASGSSARPAGATPRSHRSPRSSATSTRCSALDAEPIPDEPFDWSAVEPTDHAFVARIVELTDRACDSLLDIEFRTVARRLVARVVRRDPRALRRGQNVARAAAAFVWLAGRASGEFGRRGPRPSHTLWDWFGVSNAS